MTFFPILVHAASVDPAYKTQQITLAKQPTITNRFADGNEQVIVYHAVPIGREVQLTYEALQPNEVALLMSFYESVGYDVFFFPTRFVNFTGLWQFKEPPRVIPLVSNYSGGAYNVDLVIRKIRN